MNTIDKLVEIFKEFPGIGERQAKRFVYFLMAKNSGYAENFIGLISDLKKETTQCRECYRFFNLGQGKDKHTCEICANPETDPGILMVVEKDSDLESVRISRVYPGKYFVLGGLVPIVEKNTKRQVRVEELRKRISEDKKLKEIILAFAVSPQGDHTDHYIRGVIKDLNVKISSLGRGLSTGTELEYSDDDTIKNALRNRH